MHKKSFTFGLGVGILFVTGIFYLLSGLLAPEPIIITQTEEVLVVPSPEEILQIVQEMGYSLVEADLDQEHNIYEQQMSEFEEEPTEQEYMGYLTEQPGYLEYFEESTEYPAVLEYTEEQIIAALAELLGFPMESYYTTTEPPPQTYVQDAQDNIQYDGNNENNESVLIYLAHNTAALDVANILYHNGIINDPVAFTQFLVAQEATTTLLSGQLMFWPNSTFEQALMSLRLPSD
ncbi:MAG: hypothetical protein FWG63_10550 [Defluviitaleaceae bacterium]|nr:hypothetical protein [Defluviitaleaceae bacterium]